MSCEEKARLTMEYDSATSKFSAAVSELHRRMGTSAKDEYLDLSGLVTRPGLGPNRPAWLLSDISPPIVVNNKGTGPDVNRQAGAAEALGAAP